MNEMTQTAVAAEEKIAPATEPETECVSKADELIGTAYSIRDEKKKNSEHFGDVLVMQITMCIIILLILAGVNLVIPGFAQDFVNKFVEMTGHGPEEFFKKAVDEVMKYIYA